MGGSCVAEIHCDLVYHDGFWMKAETLVEMAKNAGCYQIAEHCLVSLFVYAVTHHEYDVMSAVNEVRSHYHLKPFSTFGPSGKNKLTEKEQAERFIKSIRKLRNEKVMKHKYDYTWIMEITNKTDGMPTFNTPKSLIDFLKSHDIDYIPSEDTINKKQNVLSGDFPDWSFAKCDTNEASRRINVGKRFLSIYRKE